MIFLLVYKKKKLYTLLCLRPELLKVLTDSLNHLSYCFIQRKGSDAKEQEAAEKPRRNVSWQDKGDIHVLIGGLYGGTPPSLILYYIMLKQHEKRTKAFFSSCCFHQAHG